MSEELRTAQQAFLTVGTLESAETLLAEWTRRGDVIPHLLDHLERLRGALHVLVGMLRDRDPMAGADALVLLACPTPALAMARSLIRVGTPIRAEVCTECDLLRRWNAREGVLVCPSCGEGTPLEGTPPSTRPHRSIEDLEDLDMAGEDGEVVHLVPYEQSFVFHAARAEWVPLLDNEEETAPSPIVAPSGCPGEAESPHPVHALNWGPPRCGPSLLGRWLAPTDLLDVPPSEPRESPLPSTEFGVVRVIARADQPGRFLVLTGVESVRARRPGMIRVDIVPGALAASLVRALLDVPRRALRGAQRSAVIGELLDAGLSQALVAETLRCSPSTVARARRRVG